MPILHRRVELLMKLSSKGAAGLVTALIVSVIGQQAASAVIAQQAPPQQAPASPSAAISRDDADAIILDRQLVMQALDKDVEVLGNIVAGAAPPTELVARTQSVAKNAKAALKAFEPNVPGGAAKPEVWTNWDDFRKRMEDFAVKSDAMAKASETGNLAIVGEHMIGALQCKQCHDVYKFKD
jgi:cytochrome c556